MSWTSAQFRLNIQVPHCCRTGFWPALTAALTCRPHRHLTQGSSQLQTVLAGSNSITYCISFAGRYLFVSLHLLSWGRTGIPYRVFQVRALMTLWTLLIGQKSSCSGDSAFSTSDWMLAWQGQWWNQSLALPVRASLVRVKHGNRCRSRETTKKLPESEIVKTYSRVMSHGRSRAACTLPEP